MWKRFLIVYAYVSGGSIYRHGQGGEAPPPHAPLPKIWRPLNEISEFTQIYQMSKFGGSAPLEIFFALTRNET